MATPLTQAKGKLELKILYDAPTRPGFTEQLAYTDLNLAHGDASMESVVAGFNDFFNAVVNLTTRSKEVAQITYTFDIDDLSDQWGE